MGMTLRTCLVVLEIVALSAMCFARFARTTQSQSAAKASLPAPELQALSQHFQASGRSATQIGEFGGKRLFTIHATRITAQNKNDAPTTKGAEQPMSSSAQPAPEMQSLAKALSGKWSTTYEFEPGGPFPSGGTGTAEEVWRTGPGGYVLMEGEHVRGPNKEVFLVAFHWWDSNTHSLRGMLCDNSGPATCDFVPTPTVR